MCNPFVDKKSSSFIVPPPPPRRELFAIEKEKKNKMKLCPALQESNISLITQYCIVYPILHIKKKVKNHIYMMRQALNHIWTKDITIRRPSGLMISALDSRLRSLSRKPGWVIVLHSWVRHLVSQCLSYPFVPRGTNGWGGERGEGVKFAMD